jgi:pimeloyl-ACP methyl ester carboxylesterase
MDVRPFKINISQEALDDLHYRLDHARYPNEIRDAGWSRGVPLDYLKKLASYWRNEYDWRAWEARLNSYPQFTTEIDGQTIHFLHIQSPEPDALPLIITHGYPGSFVEFVELIEPLTNPRKFGGDPADAFHLVIPSLPGYGFSQPLTEPGWEASRTAKAWAELMRRLGYERYGAQGGDIGSGVAGELAKIAPDHVVAVHVNTDASAAVFINGHGIDALSDEDKAHFEPIRQASQDGGAYLQIQATRPQTLGYSLTDSPVGQLAWIVEKFKEWTDPSAELPEDAVNIDQLLTNVSLYWFNSAGASAAQFIYAAFHGPQNWGDASTVPTGFANFGDPMTRRLIDPQQFIPHWSDFDKGYHFAAMEAPDLLTGDIQAFFRQYR